MAQQDISKMKKDELASFLAKKLSKEQLQGLATQVQGAGKDAGSLQFSGQANAPASGVAAGQPFNQADATTGTIASPPQGQPVTPADTTANQGTSGGQA